MEVYIINIYNNINYVTLLKYIYTSKLIITLHYPKIF